MNSFSSVELDLEAIHCSTSSHVSLLGRLKPIDILRASDISLDLPTEELNGVLTGGDISSCSNMIRSSSSSDCLINKTFKDDLNVMQSNIMSEKERNEYREEPLLKSKANLYTTTLGSYVIWKTDVNLGPPSPDIPTPEEDYIILNYYNALQYTLYETGYPETQDRTNTPITDMSSDRVAIAVLSSPVECMGIVLEGGVQCPGDMLLILSTTWLTKEKSVLKNGSCSLFVHKAITFESAGRTFIDVYNPPRRVTYLINFFTRGCTDGARDDGEELESDLDCPMSSSLTLARMIDDKLWTRIMMSDVGLLFPETLAFTFCSTLPYDTDSPDINIVSLDTKVGVENLLLEEIQKFVASPMMQKHEQIVVKPSGIMWHGSVGVTFHARTDVVSIWRAALQLLDQLEEENVVLVEAFYDTICPRNTSGLKYGCNESHACRVRATVVRGLDDKPCMTKIVCGVGLKKVPVNGDNTIPQSLDTTLIQFSVTDESRRQAILSEMKHVSESLMQRIISYEKKMSENERGGVGAQTDLIGIDYILTEVEGSIIPIGIEVNSHDCTINCHIYEFMYPNTKGEAFQAFVQTMIARSQRFIMRGKRVLVIGAGGFSKSFIWPAAKDYGIDVVLVDNNPEHFAARHVEVFIRYDLTDHTLDEVHARNIIQLVHEKDVTIDGCISFWEDCVPLSAHINHLLNLGGPGLQGALNAKKKSSTIQALVHKTGDIPHWPRTYLYTSKCFHIGCSSDIEEAAAKMEFPCVMKLEYGSSAIGVTLVNDVTQCHEEWNLVQDELQCEKSHPGIGLGHGNTMLLMDYISGTEHDVDIIIYKRKLIGSFVSDNGPTRLPKFTETAAAMPSYLPSDKSRQLIVAAYQCCVEIGLVSGVFNVELKLTPTGPKLIEINARMGGFYLRDWIKTLYSVDMLHCAFMIACDVRPILPQITPPGQMVGLMVVPSTHRKSLTDPSNMKLMHLLEENGVIRINRLEKELPPPEQDHFEEPFLNIAVLDNDSEIVKTKLIGVFSLLGFNTKEYLVEEFLKDFKRS